MRKVIVGLGDRSYPIYIGSGLLSDSSLFLMHLSAQKVLVVSNETVHPLYGKKVSDALSDKSSNFVVLPDGEIYKNLEVLNSIFDCLIENGHNRSTTLVALGGGVVGDMTGFAAACYQRGVNFIQVPTTLLSQVDSSVGGKTGVNHRLGKNMIGAFHQPKCVIIDIDSLKTLPDREYVSGMAEIIKYGLIADYEFFQWLETNIDLLVCRNAAAIEEAIERSCANKAKIVESDERESGVRALLNLGHTFGHAIEAWQDYRGMLHGEAVAVGIVIASTLSRNMGFISQNDHDRILSLLSRAGLPNLIPAQMDNETFFEYMQRDKKSVDAGLRLILLSSIGQGIIFDCSQRLDIFRALDHCRR